MTNFKKSILITGIILLCTVPVFSQEYISLEDLKEGVDSFSPTLAKSLPFNSTMGLNWSDAYIGKLFPSLPPHFGAGFSLGFTTMKIREINELLDKLGAEMPDMPNLAGMPLPGYTVETRLGEIFIPFDVGFKLGYLNFSDLFGVGMNYLLVGTDVRYALLEGEMLPLKLSVGIGFNHMKGGISTTIEAAQRYKFDGLSGEYTISANNPKIGLEWGTNTLDFKVQASFPLIVITPYIGLGASHAWSNAGYSITSQIVIYDEDGKPLSNFSEVREILEKKYGVSGITDKGFESIQKNTGWSARVFGGFSINMTAIRIDLTGMYNFLDSNWGITIGTRFQL